VGDADRPHNIDVLWRSAPLSLAQIRSAFPISPLVVAGKLVFWCERTNASDGSITSPKSAFAMPFPNFASSQFVEERRTIDEAQDGDRLIAR
jgi:hypothetical protein